MNFLIVIANKELPWSNVGEPKFNVPPNIESEWQMFKMELKILEETFAPVSLIQDT